MLSRRELILRAAALPLIPMLPALAEAAPKPQPKIFGELKPLQSELEIQIRQPAGWKEFGDLVCSVTYRYQTGGFSGITVRMTGDSLKNICQNDLDRTDGTRWNLAHNQYAALNRFFCILETYKSSFGIPLPCRMYFKLTNSWLAYLQPQRIVAGDAEYAVPYLQYGKLGTYDASTDDLTDVRAELRRRAMDVPSYG